MRAFVIVILLLALAWSYAYPHDAGRPDLNGWFESLHSGKGPCCSNADGTALADVDWKTHDGRYVVRIDDQWIDVPPEAVIDGPNLEGRAWVWPVRGYLGTSIRCFMPNGGT
jgi:hypothetical protein